MTCAAGRRSARGPRSRRCAATCHIPGSEAGREAIGTDSAVRRRMVEFLGGTSLDDASAHFVTQASPIPPAAFLPRPPTELPKLLAEQGEAARSLWDRRSLIAHLDLELVSFDRPWLPLTDPRRTLAVQRPVVDALRALLAAHGVVPLHLLSGRGHHLTWAIGRGSRAFDELAAIGRPGPSTSRLYARPQPPAGAVVGSELGRAYHGLGKVLEHLAHRALERCSGRAEVPIQITAVTVGPGARGREAISLDLSLFGDPLHHRGMRGARFFVIHPGPETSGLPRSERLQRMENAATVLDRVAERCREVGVGLVLENMLPHLFAGHVRDLLWLLGALDTTEVGICLDTGHAFLSSDLHSVAHKLSGHLWMVHASDNRGTYDDHLPPGRGAIGWATLLDQLADVHFSGALILELDGRQGVSETLRGAAEARAFLRTLCKPGR